MSIDPGIGREAALLQEVYTAGQLVNLVVAGELESVGVSPQDFSFLGWIAQLQPVTPSRLAAETGLPPTTIRDHVRRNTDRGMIGKRRNPEDGRSYHLVLSAQGQRLMDRGWPAVVAAYLRLRPHLDDPAAYLTAVRSLREALKEVVASQVTT